MNESKRLLQLFVSVFIAFALLSACGPLVRRDDGLVVGNDGEMKVDPFYQVPETDESSEHGGYRNSGGYNTSSAPNQTVLALLSQAKRQEQAGQPERAAAVIERALRIDPKNAELWHRLALLRLQQGQYSLAASLAAKSNALAANNPSLQRKNDTLIRQTKILRGG